MKPTGLSTNDMKRYMRAYQANRRKSVSHKTMAEDASILTALAAGEITVACAAKVLGCDIVAVRERLKQAVSLGVEQVRKALEARMGDLRKEMERLPCASSTSTS